MATDPHTSVAVVCDVSVLALAGELFTAHAGTVVGAGFTVTVL